MDPAEIVAALQILPFRGYDDLAARSSTAPPQNHGLYARWQSAGALPGVHGTPHPEDSGFELLYVRTAPKDATSKSNLRTRLGNHHRAAIGSSTFRLDLTTFLWQVQGWRPGWTDRPKLPDDDIAALAEWQRKHLHVQWVEVPKPWDAEKAVVHAMRPCSTATTTSTTPLTPGSATPATACAVQRVVTRCRALGWPARPEGRVGDRAARRLLSPLG